MALNSVYIFAPQWPACNFFTARLALAADTLQQSNIKILTLSKPYTLQKAGSNCGERIQLSVINMQFFNHTEF